MYAILNFFGVLFVALGSLLAWAILLSEKINFKNWKFYFSVVVIIILLILNNNNMLKFTVNTIVLAIIIKFLYHQSIKNSIIAVFFTQAIGIIYELIFSMVAIYLFKINFELGNFHPLIVLFADLFVSSGIILTVRIKLFKKLYKAFVTLTDKINGRTLLIILIPIIIIFNIYIEMTFYKIGEFYVFLLNNITIFIIMIIMYILAKKEKEYIKIYDKYNTTLNSLKEYEDILDKYRVSNHENKNQLLTIRNMISDKSKKVAKYIDEIVKNKLKDDERIMQEVSIIPAGGLRGLVYSKVLDMKQKEIEYELNISKDVRTVDLINRIDDRDMLDICQIIGVYIDNAIQEVANLKEKYINIELYLESDELVFGISNYYEGKIELDKLEEKGYTTKGRGHGYGLSLTKKIISNNKRLKNEKRLSKETFTQVLKIKMK